MVRFSVDGVAQASAVTVTGTSDIDAIGIRATNVNSFDGEIFEVQIYDKTDLTLTANINTYLANI